MSVQSVVLFIGITSHNLSMDRRRKLDDLKVD